MPEIKYTGAPTVTPEEARRSTAVPRISEHLEPVRLSTARGEAVAEGGHAAEVLGNSMRTVGASIHSLGQAFKGAGDELWQRAEGLKKLEGETNADNATVNWALEQNKRDTDFKNLKGEGANSEALAAHLKVSEDDRQNARGKLANDYERKLFDQQTRSLFIASARQAGSHAAEQTSAQAINAQEAKLSLLKGQYVKTKEDADANAFLEQAKTVYDKLRDLHGMNNDEVKVAYTNWAVTSIVGRAQEKAIVDPVAAQKLLDDNAELIKSVDPKIYVSASHQIKTQADDIGARVMADKAYGSNPDASIEDIEKKATGLANQYRPGDLQLRDKTIQRVRGTYAIEKQKQRDHEERAQNFLTEALNGLVDVQRGKKPEKFEELQALPGAKEAIETLQHKPGFLDSLHKKILDNAFGDRWADTPEARARGRDLKAMVIAGDRRFLDVKLEDEKLPRKAAHWGKDALELDQMKMRQQAHNLQENPHVKQAFGDIYAAGKLDKGYLGDSFKARQFRAVLYEALQQELQMNGGVKLTEKDHVRIGNRLLAQEPGHWFSSPAYRGALEKPPRDFADKQRADQPGVTDEQIAESYMKTKVRKMLKDDQSKTSAPKAPTITIAPVKPAPAP